MSLGEGGASLTKKHNEAKNLHKRVRLEDLEVSAEVRQWLVPRCVRCSG